MAADAGAGRGHAVLPHTADAAIEAWAPTAAGCYEEAVAAFVDLFAEIRPGHAGKVVAVFDVGPGTPEVLLVLLLEEVFVDAEVRGRVPIITRVEVRGDRLSGTFTLVPASQFDVVGSVPKGISFHDLEFGAAGGGWRCRATIDV